MKKNITKLRINLFVLMATTIFMAENALAWTKFTEDTSSDLTNFGAEFWSFFKNNVMQGAGGSIVGVGGVMACAYFIGRTMIPQAIVVAIGLVCFFKAESMAQALGMCI